MKRLATPIEDLILLEPRVFGDQRGFFLETYQQKRYADFGIPPFVQDNISRSEQNVLRGLHYQLPNAQGKLVGVTQGSVWDVAVDIRRSSPTFGQWFAVILNDENHLQLYIPPGFAHGFCVLSKTADFYYKCTDYYTPATEQGIIWNDPSIKIKWPIQNPILSPKDQLYSPLTEIMNEKLFA